MQLKSPTVPLPPFAGDLLVTGNPQQITRSRHQQTRNRRFQIDLRLHFLAAFTLPSPPLRAASQSTSGSSSQSVRVAIADFSFRNQLIELARLQFRESCSCRERSGNLQTSNQTFSPGPIAALAGSPAITNSAKSASGNWACWTHARRSGPSSWSDAGAGCQRQRHKSEVRPTVRCWSRARANGLQPDRTRMNSFRRSSVAELSKQSRSLRLDSSPRRPIGPWLRP